jgi:mannosyltransferase
VPSFVRVISATKVEKPAAVQGWKPYFLPAGIAILGLGLRFPFLGRNGLWLDEGVSASIADLPWHDFFKLLWRREANMGLYYLLLRGWNSLGDSEFAIRTLSVLFGVVSIIAVWALGRRLFGSQAGVVAALLVAVNAFHVRYSQQARGYSLLMLLVTLSTYFFVCMLEDPSQRNRRLYLATSALAFYTHFFAVLVIAAQFVSLLLFDRERRRSAPWVTTGAWMAILFAPGIVFLLLKNQGQLDWIPAVTPRSISDSLVLFAGQDGPWLLIAFVGVGALALIPSMKRSSSGQTKKFAIALIALWVLLPIVLLLLASFVKPLFVARYLTLCLPGLVLLAAAGLQTLKLPVRAGALALLVMLSLLGIRSYYAGLPDEREEWRELTRFVVNKSIAGDGLIFDNGVARPVFEHYRDDAKWPQVLFPAHGDRFTYRDFEGIATPQLAASVSASSTRVWLVTRTSNPAFEQAMLENFSKLEERAFRGAKAQLYARRSK